MSKTGYTPLPFKAGMSSMKSANKSHKSKSKAKPAKQTPLHNKNVISSIDRPYTCNSLYRHAGLY